MGSLSLLSCIGTVGVIESKNGCGLFLKKRLVIKCFGRNRPICIGPILYCGDDVLRQQRRPATPAQRCPQRSQNFGEILVRSWNRTKVFPKQMQTLRLPNFVCTCSQLVPKFFFSGNRVGTCLPRLANKQKRKPQESLDRIVGRCFVQVFSASSLSQVSSKFSPVSFDRAFGASSPEEFPRKFLPPVLRKSFDRSFGRSFVQVFSRQFSTRFCPGVLPPVLSEVLSDVLRKCVTDLRDHVYSRQSFGGMVLTVFRICVTEFRGHKYSRQSFEAACQLSESRAEEMESPPDIP